MLKNNKLLFILLFIFFILFFIFTNSTSAYTQEYNGYTFFMPDNIIEEIKNSKEIISEFDDDNYYHAVVFSSYHNRLQIFFYPKDKVSFIYSGIKYGDSLWAVPNSASDLIVYTCTVSSFNLIEHTIDLGNNSFIRKTFSSSTENALLTYNPSDNYFYFVGNIPLYKDANKSSLWCDTFDFFQQPPQEVAPQMVLAPIVEEMEMEVTLKEIIQILPLIIVIVVSFLGLRKALQMLLSLLHRCLII